MQFSDSHISAQIIVTGGNSGLGYALANEIASTGKRILLIGRDLKSLKESQLRLQEHHGDAEIMTLACDLSKPAEVHALTCELRRCNDLEIVINNAGYTVDGDFNLTDLDLYRDLISVHIGAVTEITHATMNALIRNRGHLINIASIAAFLPSPGSPLYSSTKSFIFNFSQSINARFKQQGLTCTVACPGYIRTNFHRRLGLNPEQTYRKRGLLKSHKSADVAKSILKDAYNGKSLSIHGFNYKFAYMLIKVTPNWLMARIASSITRPRL